MNNDIWSGFSLVVKGLVDAATKASYCLGFGAAGLGAALLILKRYEIAGLESTVISLAAFFILARIGKSLDDWLSEGKIRTYKKRSKEVEPVIRPELNGNQIQRIDGINFRVNRLLESKDTSEHQFSHELYSVRTELEKLNRSKKLNETVAYKKIELIENKLEELEKQISTH